MDELVMEVKRLLDDTGVLGEVECQPSSGRSEVEA